MDAKEYLSNEGYGSGTNFSTESVERLMRNYHQAKSEEEGRERYERARTYLDHSDNLNKAWHTVKTTALRIAAGITKD